MTTRPLVPNAAGEGSIGTADKPFGSAHVTTPPITDKSNRVATTALISAVVHAIYPVGSIIYSEKAANPATYLPYMSDTKWVQTAQGRVLIGAGTGTDANGTKMTFKAGDTGGEYSHQLTVDELPKNIGDFSTLAWGGGSKTGAFGIKAKYTPNLGANAGSGFGSVIYDDEQECCVVDGDFLSYPNGTYSGYSARIQDLLDAQAKRTYVPPAEPTEEDQKASLKADYDSAVKELTDSMAVALLTGDTAAQESIRADFADLQKAYKEAIGNV